MLCLHHQLVTLQVDEGDGDAAGQSVAEPPEELHQGDFVEIS